MIPKKVPVPALLKDPVAIDRDAKLAAAINQLVGMFQLTSNTNLRISVTGTDGVTRKVDLTLS